jgi:hypothetical protein
MAKKLQQASNKTSSITPSIEINNSSKSPNSKKLQPSVQIYNSSKNPSSTWMKRATNAHQLDNGKLSPIPSPVKVSPSLKVSQKSSSSTFKWSALIVLIALIVRFMPIPDSSGTLLEISQLRERLFGIKIALGQETRGEEMKDEFPPHAMRQ